MSAPAGRPSAGATPDGRVVATRDTRAGVVVFLVLGTAAGAGLGSARAVSALPVQVVALLGLAVVAGLRSSWSP